jgi:hypothetical protein
MVSLSTSAPASAQSLADSAQPSAPAAAAIASGRVVIPGREREIPVSGVIVTLHRVGSDTAGPLDSIATDAEGRYTLRYRRFGRDDAVYFAATVYRGIAYFSDPIRSVRSSGPAGEITVFDTTSRGVTLHVQGHHIVVSAPGPTGGRDVVEVYELSNDTTVTLVGRDSLSAVWSAPVPRGATRFAGGQGDVAPSVIALRGSRAIVLAPFGPGVKQLSFSYTLAPGDFPLSHVVEEPTSVLEVLLEEKAAQVRGAALRSMDTVSTQGRTFKRFLAQDVAKGQAVRVDVPAASSDTRTRVLVGVAVLIVAAMAAAFARAMSRQGRRSLPFAPRVAPLPAPAESETLLAAIATLDASRQTSAAGTDDPDYAARRAALKARLVAALANEGRETSET